VKEVRYLGNPRNGKLYGSGYWAEANLGWKQLLYGQITRAWMALRLNNMAPLINSKNFFSKIIYKSWMVLLTIW